MNKILTFAALLFLLAACDKKHGDEPSSAQDNTKPVVQSEDSVTPKNAPDRQDLVETVTENGELDRIREIIEPDSDNPEAPVIEPAPPQPITQEPTGLEDLGLSEDQQNKIDQWIAERNGDPMNSEDLLRHIESLLDEEQKEAFMNMVQSNGRSSGSDGE